ncbi:hypothetical protein [Streptomyces sp. NBC_00878]|uniref:hypothetical protein n=1 Tax=Streptomyces sp. NBC_00878 TaxID=2975854 RepID=UPI002255497A|nr:hypothetical protein [Streptomyces sp. NBC_00878]MCX4906914.1 hypothetical protein [Streptomyces sp. NBC_00878]
MARSSGAALVALACAVSLGACGSGSGRDGDDGDDGAKAWRACLADRGITVRAASGGGWTYTGGSDMSATEMMLIEKNCKEKTHGDNDG